MERRDLPEEVNRISGAVVDAAWEVHRTLGPGLLESMYTRALAYELEARGIPLAREVPVPAVYKGRALGVGYRADLVVADCVVVEVKASDRPSPQHEAQLLTYLRLLHLPVGLLLNFDTFPFPSGVRRVVCSDKSARPRIRGHANDEESTSP